MSTRPLPAQVSFATWREKRYTELKDLQNRGARVILVCYIISLPPSFSSQITCCKNAISIAATFFRCTHNDHVAFMMRTCLLLLIVVVLGVFAQEQESDTLYVTPKPSGPVVFLETFNGDHWTEIWKPSTDPKYTGKFSSIKSKRGYAGRGCKILLVLLIYYFIRSFSSKAIGKYKNQNMFEFRVIGVSSWRTRRSTTPLVLSFPRL
jgi:hypothetical protein